jgi:HAD superfamily hydrolase (TIGR01450 family)
MVPTSTWVIDLDGVVWLTGEPIAGGAAAIQRLSAAGVRALFVTNNSSPTVAELQERLLRCDITSSPTDVISSADAVATMLEPGSTASLLADAGVAEALQARGVRIAVRGPVDAVVVGWTHEFDFATLSTAASAVRAGARLLGTNEDATHPTPQGLLPGSGALLAAVSVASGVEPEVAGKPHRPIVDVINQRAGNVSMVVGDRPSTDGALAQRLGVPYALVLSGVTAPHDDLPTPAPDRVATDLLALVEQVYPM